MYDAFVDIIHRRGLVDAEHLLQARQESELSGGSFDVITYLFQAGLITEDVFPEIAEAFRKHAALGGDRALEKGVRKFLGFLEAAKQPFGIMSYGNPRWQNLKISACGLGDAPRMIVSNQYKGRAIASWYQPETAAFLVPADLYGSEVAARQIVLIDDKAAAFDGLHEQAVGYWLQLTVPLLPSQEGNVPAHTAVVRGYDEIIAAEQDRVGKGEGAASDT